MHYIGGNVHLLPDLPINGTLFLHQQHTLLPRWRQIASAFQNMNKNLKELKYQPSSDDPNYVPDPRRNSYGTSHIISKAEDILKLGDYELYQRYMPMPTLSILIPPLRYLLWFFRRVEIHLFTVSFYF